MDACVEPFKCALTLAHFKAVKEVGAGSQGTVMRGTVKATGRVVAIKRSIRSSTTDDSSFFRELNVWARVSGSSFLPPLLGFSLNDSTLLVFSELYAGDLRDMINTASVMRPFRMFFALPTVLDVANTLACGLLDLKAAGSMHRDVKPENIFVDADTARVFLGDVGCASREAPHRAMTICGAVTSFEMESLATAMVAAASEGSAGGTSLAEKSSSSSYTCAIDVCDVGGTLLEMMFLPQDFLTQHEDSSAFSRLKGAPVYPPRFLALVDSTRLRDPMSRPTLREFVGEVHAIASELCPALQLLLPGTRDAVELLNGGIMHADDGSTGGDGRSTLPGMPSSSSYLALAAADACPALVFSLPRGLAGIVNPLRHTSRLVALLSRCSGRMVDNKTHRLPVADARDELELRLERALLSASALEVAEAFSGLTLGPPAESDASAHIARAEAAWVHNGGVQPYFDDTVALGANVDRAWAVAAATAGSGSMAWAVQGRCVMKTDFSGMSAESGADKRGMMGIEEDDRGGSVALWDSLILRTAADLAATDHGICAVSSSFDLTASSSRFCVLCGVTRGCCENKHAKRHYKGAARHRRAEFLAAAIVILHWLKQAALAASGELA